jgi:hypothetical protein
MFDLVERRRKESKWQGSWWKEKVFMFGIKEMKVWVCLTQKQNKKRVHLPHL